MQVSNALACERRCQCRPLTKLDNGGNQTDAPDGAPPSRERKEALDTVA